MKLSKRMIRSYVESIEEPIGKVKTHQVLKRIIIPPSADMELIELEEWPNRNIRLIIWYNGDSYFGRLEDLKNKKILETYESSSSEAILEQAKKDQKLEKIAMLKIF